MATARITVHQWLVDNGYRDEAKMIARIEEEWRDAGKRTRRNWWDVLAGDRHGNPRVIAGRTFPVIAEIRRRQELEPSPVAVSSGYAKRAPKPIPQGRWGGQFRNHI